MTTSIRKRFIVERRNANANYSPTYQYSEVKILNANASIPVLFMLPTVLDNVKRHRIAEMAVKAFTVYMRVRVE